MERHEEGSYLEQLPAVWEILARVSAPQAELRSLALDELQQIPDCLDDPLVVYLLATRLSDPELGVRCQVVKIIGSLLAADGSRPVLCDRALAHLVARLETFGKDHYTAMLEVAAVYLTAEEPLGNILKVSSYAGKSLSGIVNDRKLPLRVRQQAIYYCGEIGFLNTAAALQNLIKRLERDKAEADADFSPGERSDRDVLYMYAVSALGKLGV